MDGSWLIVVSITLVTLGILAEINLMRIFIGDWLKGRREERARAFPQATSHIAPPIPRVASWWTMNPVPRAAVLLVPLIVVSVAAAQTAGDNKPATEVKTTADPKAETATGANPEPAAAKSPMSLQLNFDYTTAYFYHGIIQEDTGFIFQPAAKLTINLFEENDFKIDAILATWNSFHGQKTGAATRSDFTEYWYESDVIGGFAFTKGKLSLTTTYIFLTSPSNAYETVQELDLTLAFDDGEWLGAWALHPYALLGIETGADASDGANSDTGVYLELGIAPGFSFDVGQTPIAISFPVAVGLSLSDYYQDATGDDDTFGFAQIGAKASVPLPFGDRYGKWSLNAGVSVMFLGDHTRDYNAGDDTQVIGTIGLQVNF